MKYEILLILSIFLLTLTSSSALELNPGENVTLCNDTFVMCKVQTCTENYTISTSLNTITESISRIESNYSYCLFMLNNYTTCIKEKEDALDLSENHQGTIDSLNQDVKNCEADTETKVNEEKTKANEYTNKYETCDKTLTDTNEELSSAKVYYPIGAGLLGAVIMYVFMTKRVSGSKSTVTHPSMVG